MGKKDKKKKGLGKAKTEAKAAKKADKASRRAREVEGEDVEAILAEILAKEAESIAVAEHQNVEPPTPRAAFTMIASPINDHELIQFGGERYTGDRAAFFNDLYVFNVEKKTWTKYDSPTRPPPRSSHAVALHKNMMYMFGGEFSNPSLSQYRHYRDLWRLDLEDMSWERIDIRGGPTARSGSRMCVLNNKLVVFGGFFDTGFENKYLNDLYYVDLLQDDLKWTKVEFSAVDIVPSPRSGFQWVVSGSEAFLYGGYCREAAQKAKNVSHKGKKKGGSAVEEAMVSRGVVLTDCYKLIGETLKWQKVKRTGYGPSQRAGFSMVLHKRNAVLFGGVEDDETEEEMQSIFYNDMFALNLDRRKWFPMTLRKKGGKKGRRRRKKAPEDPDQDAMEVSTPGDTEEANVDIDLEEEDDEEKENELDTEALEAALMAKDEEARPCGRFNAAIMVQKNVMFIAGGVVEKGDKEITLDDIWAIDLNKLDEFKELKGLSEECAEWVASDEEDEDEDMEDEGQELSDEEMHEDEDDAVDRKRRRGGRRERLRERVGKPEDDHFTPKINESLKDFFERTRPYWVGEVHEALGESGKSLRRIAFEWAFKRYWEIKPSLRELEELEAELAREEELEKAFAQAQLDQKRGRSRR